eukprot:Skav211374  [mRNA]  locus=scaffold2406:55438:57222:+ [translate_table: standard]
MVLAQDFSAQLWHAMSSRRVDFERGKTSSPRGPGGRWEEDFEDSGAQSGSDAVLLRCRDTIERLHGDMEEERQKRQRLQEQLEESDNELAAVKMSLAEEQQKTREAETKCRRLEQKVVELEQLLKAQKEMNGTTSSQLQTLKAESIQKAQEQFSQNLRITDLENSLKRAEAKAQNLQQEASKTDRQLREAEARATSEADRLRSERQELESKTVELEKMSRHCAELEHRCESLEQNLEDLQHDKHAIVESNQFELQELAMRQERLQAAWRDGEQELQRAFQERDELQKELDQCQQEAEHLQKQVRDLSDEQRSAVDKCQRLESELKKTQRKADDLRAESDQKGQDFEQLQMQQRTHSTTIATLEQQLEDQRRQLFERNQELARQRVEYAKAVESLEGAKGGVKHQEDRNVRLLASEKESQKRAAELTWRLEAANEEVEQSRAALKSEQDRCKELQSLLDQRQQESRETDLNQLSNLLAQAQAHATCLAQVQSERVSAEENEPLKSLKLKYDQKISKLYQHLCERDAYERKLKGFIENEVSMLHQYNKELEQYCQWRRERLPDVPRLIKSAKSTPAADKIGRRLLRNLQNLEDQLA